MADTGERGGEWALSCHDPLSAGVFFKPPGSSAGPAYTVNDTLFLLLLSHFLLSSLVSYLMMPPLLWGVKPISLPGSSPTNLQTSSIEATCLLPDQHPNRRCGMVCDKEKTMRPLQT